tara:strand:+ start:3127 stop:4752 length:1626 start_codon:yes stop_codon:yes gene_type:complete
MGYGGGDPSTDAAFGTPVALTGIRKGKPKETIKKSVSYVATGTDSNQILAISQTASSSAVKTATPKAIDIKNTGTIPVVAMIGYESYSDEDTDAGTKYLHALILPGETISPPMRGMLPTANQLHVLDGEVLDFTAPNTALKVDTGDNVASGEFNNTTDPVVFELDNGHDKYRVGDYLRIDDEIVKVEGTFADNPTTSTVADNHIVVSRGHFGSTVAAESGTPDVFFTHFNEHYDFDRALSGSSQLVQTDVMGRFRACNFFGYGRVADGSAFGLVPGSVIIRFYSSAYQEVMMGGTGTAGGGGAANVSNISINSSTDTKLTASTAYAFDITIDDSAATTVSFTTDSSNTNFGGTNGVISKIQNAINTATRTVGNALFGYSCTASIVNGKLRFTSNSHLIPHDGTNGSKILLADASSGTNLFAGTSGIFPDIILANAPVKPKLPDLYTYDRLTYSQVPNKDQFCYDNGHGRLQGTASGTINYETGAIDIVNAPSNACFEVSAIHNSPFSGKLDADKAEANCITAIHANVLNRRLTGEIEVKTY